MNTEIVKSKKFQIAALVVGMIIIAFVSFAGGVFVGFRKAKFSYKFGENYERNFIEGPHSFGPMRIPPAGGGPGPRGFIPDFPGRGFRNAHGIAGEIISVADGKIVIKDPDSQENTISVSDETLIKRGKNTISINDLKNGDRIVVMGRPGDDGTVQADLVRVFEK